MSLPLRSVRKREAILSAGRQLFLLQGYRGTSVDEIATLAAVSKQTVYKHFGDKRELLQAIVTSVLDGAVQPFLEKVAVLAQTLDVERELVALGTEYVRSVLAEPVVQLRRLVIGQANAVPELAQIYYQQAPEQTLDALAHAFGVLHQRGLLQIVDSYTAAMHFASLVVGLQIDRALFFGGQATLDDIDLDEHVRAAVRVFLAAHAPPRARASHH